MIASDFEIILHRVFVDARGKCPFVTVEHLLLGLLENPDVVRAVGACGADVDQLRSRISEHLSEASRASDAGEYSDTQPNMAFQGVIQRAILKAQSAGKKEVGSIDVLLAILAEKDTPALRMLNECGVQWRAVAHFASHPVMEAPGTVPQRCCSLRALFAR